MKQNSITRNAYTICAALLLTVSLTQCGIAKKNCCGYKGPIVSQAAIALYAKDHFIPKATIDEWTNRFDTYKNKLSDDSLRALVKELGSSYSYNGYYVNLILCNRGSIGIRILPGLDADYKLHFILVGIKPDYSTLYIPQPPGYQAWLPKKIRTIWGTNSVDETEHATYDGTMGGLQFSQRP